LNPDSTRQNHCATVLVPKAAFIAVLLDPNARAFEAELRDLEEAGRVLGLQMLIGKAGSDREIDAAFAYLLPTKYELVINLASANALGLEIPSTLCLQATMHASMAPLISIGATMPV
jgi:hypothetical protein